MSIDKKSLSERNICTKFITPAIKDVAGWNISQCVEEFTLGNIHAQAICEWVDVKRVEQLLSLCDALEAQLRSTYGGGRAAAATFKSKSMPSGKLLTLGI